MLEIKTITENITNADRFDQRVNDELLAGWDLIRRTVVQTPSGAYLYAELESEFEEKTLEDNGIAAWTQSGDPVEPYKCTACGGKSRRLSKVCPHCLVLMVNAEKD